MAIEFPKTAATDVAEDGTDAITAKPCSYAGPDDIFAPVALPAPGKPLVVVGYSSLDPGPITKFATNPGYTFECSYTAQVDQPIAAPAQKPDATLAQEITPQKSPEARVISSPTGTPGIASLGGLRISDSSLYNLLHFTPAEERTPLISALLKGLAHAGGLEPIGEIPFYQKERVVIASAETAQGKVFLKLVDADAGMNELTRGIAMKEHFPVEHAVKVVQAGSLGLVVQPYVQSIGPNRGMLTDVISQLEIEKHRGRRGVLLDSIQEIYEHLHDMSVTTMDLASGARVPNDIFFADRLQANARLDQNCAGQLFDLNGVRIGWEELLGKKWVVDGVEYEETLAQLIERARINLNPDRLRLLSLCHGDGTEMNYISNALNLLTGEDPRHIYKMIDLETAGVNSLIGDGINHLIYMTVMAAHTVPRYHSEHFQERSQAMANYERLQWERVRPGMEVSMDQQRVVLTGVEAFGTSEARKKLASVFIDSYLQRLFDRAEAMFGPEVHYGIEETVRSCIFMRLLAVHSVPNFNAEDQAKIFGLLYKTIGHTGSNGKSALERFKEAI